MKNRITIPLFAIIVAIAIGAGGMAFSQKSNKGAQNMPGKEVFFANYYYNFTGDPGEEDDETLWELVDASFFNNSTCSQAKNGCVIKTISSAQSAPTHPAYVPVTGSGSAMTPVDDDVNIAEAKLKNPL